MNNNGRLVKTYKNIDTFMRNKILYPKKYKNNKKRINENIYVCAVDVWLYAHKFQYSHRNIFIGFWNQIIKLLSHRIIPIYVFDGKPPDEKNDVLKMRNAKKEKLKDKIKVLKEQQNEMGTESNTEEINAKIKKLNKQIIYITKYNIDMLKSFLNIMHIPYLEAECEADSLCAKLYKDNYIDACLSDDMDILAYGCNKLMKLSGKHIIEYDLDIIMRKLKMSYKQFVDMCILFGCDYLKSNPRIKPELSYRLIKEYGTLEEIIDQYMDEDNEKHKRFIDNYKNARNIFLTASNDECIPNDFNTCITDKIDKQKVIDFLQKFCSTHVSENDHKRIGDSIDSINTLIKNGTFSFKN